MSNPSVGDKARYAAERVMEPILRRWFEIDLEPVNLDSNAENAAVDLSWALESAGLLLPIVIAGEAPTRKDGDARVLTDVPPPPPPAPVDDREREGEVIDNVRAFLTEIVQSNPPHPDAAFEMVQSLAKVHLRALAERPVSSSVDPEEG